MKVGGRKIDHIVYAVKDLEEGIQQMETLLGVAPVFGGYHITEGTKNAILNLGQGVYLELITIDYDNKEIQPPRWMGVDCWTKNQIVRWAVKSNELSKDSAILADYNANLAITKAGQRKMADGAVLTWELSMPDSEPEVEVVPFLLDWKDSAVHPTNSLVEQCELIGLKLFHPTPAQILPTLRDLSIDLDVNPSDQAQIRAVIQSPNGVVEI